MSRAAWACFSLTLLSALPAAAQVDPQRAAAYFKEAAALCAREGGKLWEASLCGPMVFADAATHTIATNRPVPAAKRPAVLGLANAALPWGADRWSSYVWQLLPADPHARARLMLHELFHRIQPKLGLLGPDAQNPHLDTLDGRYWLMLEWRALSRALGTAGVERLAALRDALAFRRQRRALFPGSAENERRLELNEGLAQYTGTVAAAASRSEAVGDAIAQLADAEQLQTFVRTFPYPSGAAYGLLLDEILPGWTHSIKVTDDLGQMVVAGGLIKPAADPAAAAARYGGPELRIAEAQRDSAQQLRIAELRKRFVDGPTVIVPNGGRNTFTTNGMTPLPGEGTVYPGFRTVAEWGTLEAASVLVSLDRNRLTLAGPAQTDGPALKGPDWTLWLTGPWYVRPGKRPGDLEILKNPAGAKP